MTDTAYFNKSNRLSRRRFIRITSLSATGLLIGCATDPVTGKKTFNMVSEAQEIGIDKQYSPFQFSNDYGAVQDNRLSDYIDRLGNNMAPKTHRPQMPYNFQVVNANYINAYAFPGGSIAATRGILLKLKNEAELAALVGHELGHVNARHSAEQMSKGQIAQLGVGIGSVIAGAKLGKAGADMVGQLGSLGASALLASYSRDNEREADALGMEYLVRSGYGPKGMVGLMEMLDGLHKKRPSSASTLFSTHPMSTERLKTAVKQASGKYQAATDLPLHRERYMDHTAKLRRMKEPIERMQKAEERMQKAKKAMAKKNYSDAEKNYSDAEKGFRTALRKAKNDYTGLVLLSRCLAAQKKYPEALKYAERARKVYPQEAQAMGLSGQINMEMKKYNRAYQDFSSYEKRLPGNPSITFLKGYSMEGMRKKNNAAQDYFKYLNAVKQGKMAKHAYTRLIQWGYMDKSGRRLK